MPNYKEQNVTGYAWVRSNLVHIYNDFQNIPAIRFDEEKIVDIGNGFIKQPQPGGLVETFANPQKTFKLRNPETFVVTGTATYQDVYIMLQSLYLSLALDRDAREAAINE